ncbi:hypothetical protein Tco_1315399 [Tanacetum coccineum]
MEMSLDNSRRIKSEQKGKELKVETFIDRCTKTQNYIAREVAHFCGINYEEGGNRSQVKEKRLEDVPTVLDLPKVLSKRGRARSCLKYNFFGPCIDSEVSCTWNPVRLSQSNGFDTAQDLKTFTYSFWSLLAITDVIYPMRFLEVLAKFMTKLYSKEREVLIGVKTADRSCISMLKQKKFIYFAAKGEGNGWDRHYFVMFFLQQQLSHEYIDAPLEASLMVDNVDRLLCLGVRLETLRSIGPGKLFKKETTKKIHFSSRSVYSSLPRDEDELHR